MVKTIKGSNAIRDRPDMYLTRVPPQAWELATKIGQEALILGATLVQTSRLEDWWLISADLDWLPSQDDELTRLFEQIVPFPEQGQNSHRSEVLLNVFANEIVTRSQYGETRIKGNAMIELPALPENIQRIVAFRMSATLRHP
jgi:hypothetical protein